MLASIAERNWCMLACLVGDPKWVMVQGAGAGTIVEQQLTVLRNS